MSLFCLLYTRHPPSPTANIFRAPYLLAGAPAESRRVGLKMVDQIAGQGQLGRLGWSAADAIDRGRVIGRHTVGVFKAQLGSKRNRTAHPEIKPHQVLAIAGFVTRALPLEVVKELVANV